ncbi:serine hydrolase [candidate division KSB1 bacterium]|nr:serine hydrolase [candidate division KSB1 bacterium]
MSSITPAIQLSTLVASNNIAFDSSRARLDRFLKILSDTLHAEFGVAFRDLSSGLEYSFNPKVMMHAASTMKVPVMIEIFRQAEQGKLRLTDSVLVQNQFASIIDGSPYSLDLADDSDEVIYQAIGKKLTIRQLIEAMITVSSNLATNVLIELVGAKNVMNTLTELGIQNMLVLRGVEDGKAYQAGLNNRTDAYALMQTMAAIAEERAASPIACREMIAILKAQKFRENIPAGLPDEVVVANKTGSITALDHDAAIFYPPGRGPCVLVVLTRGIAEHKRAHQTIASIAQRIYKELVNPDASVSSPF